MSTLHLQGAPSYHQGSQTVATYVPQASELPPCNAEVYDAYVQAYLLERAMLQPSYDQVPPPRASPPSPSCRSPSSRRSPPSTTWSPHVYTTPAYHEGLRGQAFQTEAANPRTWSYPESSPSEGAPLTPVETMWDGRSEATLYGRPETAQGPVVAIPDHAILEWLGITDFAEICSPGQPSFPGYPDYTTGYDNQGVAPAYPVVQGAGNHYCGGYGSPCDPQSSFTGSDAFGSITCSSSTGEYSGPPYNLSGMTAGYVTQPVMTPPEMLVEPLGIGGYGLEGDPPNGSTSSRKNTTIGHDTEVSWQTCNQTPTRAENVAIARLGGLPPGYGVFAVESMSAAPRAKSKRKKKEPDKRKSPVRRKADGQILPADLGPVKARLGRRNRYKVRTQQDELWGGAVCPFDRIEGGRCKGILSDTHVAACHIQAEARVWDENHFDEQKISTWDRKWILCNKKLAKAAAKAIYVCRVGDCEEAFTRSDVLRRHRRRVHKTSKGDGGSKAGSTTMGLLNWIGGLG